MTSPDGSVKEEPAKCNEDGIFRPKVCDEVKDMGYECKPLYVAASYQATCLVEWLLERQCATERPGGPAAKARAMKKLKFRYRWEGIKSVEKSKGLANSCGRSQRAKGFAWFVQLLFFIF